MMSSLAFPVLSSSRMSGRRPLQKKPWCARLSVSRSGGVDREFVDAAIEWHDTRVTHYFILPEGAYEVFEPTSPREGRRYFVISRDGCAREAEFTEVLACLSEC